MLKKFLILFCLSLILFTSFLFYKNNSPVEQEPALLPAEQFKLSTLKEKAKELSLLAYKAPDENLPESIKNLSYDQYRDIRFVREQGPWFGQRLPFEMQFFHVGSIFQYSVLIL